MSGLNDFDEFELLDDGISKYAIRNIPGRARRNPGKLQAHAVPRPKLSEPEIVEQDDSFSFSYHATRHERVWIYDALKGFHDGRWLDDVLRLIKGGKEAHVYQCLANSSVEGLQRPEWKQPYLAAKIYRPRKFRNLKNDHLYREGRHNLDEEGREVTNDGMLHAMAKRTEYGRELLHTSWIEHEYNTLRMLYSAGADVPRPLVSSSNAILMSYIGDDDTPAPTLNSVRLSRREASLLFDRVVHNIDLMLGHARIHADLSAYNILYRSGEITLIDFPQAIDPAQNRNAYPIFERDVIRICEYFARQGVKTEPRSLASGLWKKRRYPQTPDIHPGLLDPEDEGDRRLWNDRRSPAH